MEDQALNPVELAQGRIDAATAAINETKAAQERNKAESTTARQFLADCKEALKTIDKGDTENRAKGQTAIDGAKASLDELAEQKAGLAKLLKDWQAELKAARSALKEAKAATKAAPKEKVEREQRNGQTRPAEGTISATLWGIFDSVTAEKGGEPAAFSEVLEPALAAGVVEGSVRAGYAHWRKFHGITGRVQSAEQRKAAELKAQEKAKREAEKAAKAAAEATQQPAPATA